MARPLRIESHGAVYHITARGNARNCIFLEDRDRDGFLDILSDTRQRYSGLCHALCLMDNHYHLLIETIDPTTFPRYEVDQRSLHTVVQPQA